MLKRIIFTVSFILISLYGFAQKDINNYKYIVVPKQFDFSNSEDQYQLNSLAKFLFNKYGYEAYLIDDDFPEELKTNRCLALTSEVSNEKNGMFKTKLEFVLKDCFGAVVMTSQIGESRLKKFDKAYTEALRHAFETFQKLDYKYVPKGETITVAPKSETINLKESKVERVKEKDTELAKDDVKENPSEVIEKSLETESLYYAQAIEDGFQLVDAEPKIVMILISTSAKEIFIVKDKNAIVYKENNTWIYYENNDSKKIKKTLLIKF